MQFCPLPFLDVFPFHPSILQKGKWSISHGKATRKLVAHIYTYTDTKKRGFQIPGVYPHMKEKFPNLHLLYNHGEQAQPPLA